jgi:hypothetical protein
MYGYNVCTTIAKALLPTSPNPSVVDPIDALQALINELKTLNDQPKRDKKAIDQLEKAIDDLLKGNRKLFARSQQREDFARNAVNNASIGGRSAKVGKATKVGKGTKSPSKSRSRSNNAIKAAEHLLKAYKYLNCQDDPVGKLGDICTDIADIIFAVLTNSNP